jgi:hypothetical protein
MSDIQGNQTFDYFPSIYSKFGCLNFASCIIKRLLFVAPANFGLLIMLLHLLVPIYIVRSAVSQQFA